ncbi:MAG TPA: suppressor of fused domain protein [Streptosporangiaceae bacterium]|nr:suppressor of fused domain protein [Streptosporangiaceae bacterium]
MPTLRRGGSSPRITATPEQPRILLDSESPYASRRVTVECDGATTVAYLHSAAGPVGAAWIANHVPAPATADLARLNAGHAPLMPAAHTKHPDGRPMLEPDALRALWLEEGDGVVILEYGGPLAILPGWSDMSRGLPGYCRDVIGQTPFGWSLDDALEGLGPRAAQAEDFWRWRGDKNAWADFQQAVLGHLLVRLGPGGRYWDVGGGKQPLVGVSERPPAGQRPYTVLSTVGMSCQRMPVIEQMGDLANGSGRIELAIATTMPSTEAARIFLWLGQYPWREMTWLGGGHCIPWYHEPATFPLGGGNEAVLLLDKPGSLLGPDVPDLSGFAFGGETVKWLWIVPLSDRERVLAAERGPASLVTHLAAQRRSWVVGQA